MAYNDRISKHWRKGNVRAIDLVINKGIKFPKIQSVHLLGIFF